MPTAAVFDTQQLLGICPDSAITDSTNRQISERQTSDVFINSEPCGMCFKAN